MRPGVVGKWHHPGLGWRLVETSRLESATSSRARWRLGLDYCGFLIPSTRARLARVLCFYQLVENHPSFCHDLDHAG